MGKTIIIDASNWQRLNSHWQPNEAVLQETLIGGQAFTWSWDDDSNCWIGHWNRHLFALRFRTKGALEFQAISNSNEQDLLTYLGLSEPRTSLPDIPDPHYQELKETWEDLLILNQDFGETLLGFLCSSNKQIIQIRQMLKNLAFRFGERIKGDFYRLPTWQRLADCSLDELKACSLGYRAKYVLGTAQFIKTHPTFIEELHNSDDQAARDLLLQLPGVGGKVADCVLLFGLGRMSAFPIDTWIDRHLRATYDLSSWSRPQLQQFVKIHFGNWAGLVQQWMFAQSRVGQAHRLKTFCTLSK